MNLIEAQKQGINVKCYDFGLWLHEVCDVPQSHPVSLEGRTPLPESKYKTFFGVEKKDFDDLFSSIAHRLRSSVNRSCKDALGIFLMLLRNNNTQEFIAHLFGTTQRVVSEAITAVGLALEAEFVPKHLGYHHITREEAIVKHARKLTSGVLEQDSSRLCVMADCTYIFIEKPGDFWLQRKTFSMHKMRNLLKPLLLCFPSGYIIDVVGPFFCDSENNDAACIKYHYENSDLLLILEDDDYFIFDRGFRDVVEETVSNGQSVFMPSMLDKKRKRFTCEEANESRKVTMNRWVNESVNGRLKNVFPFFKHTVESRYVPKVMQFVRIACAIMNAYFPPLFEDKEFHQYVIQEVATHEEPVNSFFGDLESRGLTRMTQQWKKATATSVSSFPKLSWEDLKQITLGSYQLAIAAKYIAQHLKEGPSNEFGIFLHRDSSTIIRAKIHSRMSKSKDHSVWIKYNDQVNGKSGIVERTCDCKVGLRSLGCCSHVATVLRYLGFDRHQPAKQNRRVSRTWNAIDAKKDLIAQSSGESEEEIE